MNTEVLEKMKEICKNLLKDRVSDSVLEEASRVNALNALGIKLQGDEKRLYATTKHFCMIPKVLTSK